MIFKKVIQLEYFLSDTLTVKKQLPVLAHHKTLSEVSNLADAWLFKETAAKWKNQKSGNGQLSTEVCGYEPWLQLALGFPYQLRTMAL